MATDTEARASFKSAPLTPHKGSSRFAHVSWNRTKGRWQPIIGVKGRMFALGSFVREEEDLAARVADLARWYLQDFLPRAPKFNFPEEYAEARFIDRIPAKVLAIRCMLLSHGVQRNAPHFPGAFEQTLLQSKELVPESVPCSPEAASSKPEAAPRNIGVAAPSGVSRATLELLKRQAPTPVGPGALAPGEKKCECCDRPALPENKDGLCKVCDAANRGILS